MLETGYGYVPDAWKETLEMPITAEELKAVVFKETAKFARKRRYRTGVL